MKIKDELVKHTCPDIDRLKDIIKTIVGEMTSYNCDSDIEEVIGDNKWHLIATSACLGGYIPRMLIKGRDNPNEKELYNEAIDDTVKAIKELCAFTILEEEEIDEMARQLKLKAGGKNE